MRKFYQKRWRPQKVHFVDRKNEMSSLFDPYFSTSDKVLGVDREVVYVPYVSGITFRFSQTSPLKNNLRFSGLV